MNPLAAEDLVDATALLAALERRWPGLVVTEDQGDLYLFHDPAGVTEPTHRFPFVTVMTGDRYDGASDLDRDPTTYRVNVGLTRAAYEERLGPAPRQPAGHEVVETGADHRATDVVLPHPFYAPMHWIAVVSPAERTREELSILLDDARERAVAAYHKKYPE